MSKQSYDVMISYRWRRFAVSAKALADFLGELGVRVWLDILEIDQPNIIPFTKLAESLSDAVLKSKLLLFFETDDSLLLNEEGIAFNWQIFELQHATEVLFACPREAFPNLIRSCSFDHIKYYNIPYLAYLLAIAVGKTEFIDSYWNKYFSEVPQSTASAYHIWKFHSLPNGVPLPPIIDPHRPDARPNKVSESFIENRRDIKEENRFTLVPGPDYSRF